MAETTQTSVGAEGGVDQSVATSLGLNGQLFLFQLLNFAIVAVILWFLILKPLTKTMEERKKMIDDSIDNAKTVETNLKMSEQKYQEKIDQAKIEANAVITKAVKDAEASADIARAKAEKEIALLVDQAKRNITIEKEEMREELRRETAGLVVSAVEKLLGEKLDDKKDTQFIEKILKSSK